MKLKTLSAILLSTSLFTMNSWAADETITYKNARGSTLTLNFHADNTVTGTFITAVASKDCKQAIGTKKPVIGFTADNAITMSVGYPECGATVSFAGNMENNKKMIDTTAIIVHQSQQINKEGPGARMLSHDVFTKI